MDNLRKEIRSIILPEGLPESEVAVDWLEKVTDKLVELFAKHRCNHKETDYSCPCFHEGFETADAENCYNKIEEIKELKKEREELIKKVEEMRRITFDQSYRDALDDVIKWLSKKYEKN